MATNSTASKETSNIKNASQSGCPCKFEDTDKGKAHLKKIEDQRIKIQNLKNQKAYLIDCLRCIGLLLDKLNAWFSTWRGQKVMQKYAYFEKNKNDFSWGKFFATLIGLVVAGAIVILTAGAAAPLLIAAGAAAAGGLAAGTTYALCDMASSGCKEPVVLAEFFNWVQNESGTSPADCKCIGEVLNSGLIGRTVELIIDIYSIRIQNANARNWDDIDWPIPGAGGIVNVYRKSATREAEWKIRSKEEEIKAAEKELQRLLEEEKQLRKDHEEACKYLMEQAAKIKDPANDFVVSTFASGKIKTSLFDLRNIDYKNFRGDKPTPEQEKMKNNKMMDDPSLNRAILGNRVISYSKSYKFNKDFLITDTLALYKDLEIDEGARVLGMSSGLVTKPLVQSLILNEFQPYDMISPADLLPGATEFLAQVAGSVSNLVGGNAVISLGKNAMMTKKINHISRNPAQLYSGSLFENKNENGIRKRKYFSSDPVQVVQNMFNGGKWLNTYEIPFYGRDYLVTNHANKWNLQGAEGFWGSAVAGEKDKPLSLRGFGVDFPSNPKFKADMNNTRGNIKTEFYLVNTNTSWLKQNFKFIQAFYAGTEWLHLAFCQHRPPNVYHVLCPGRFQIYWAALDLKVTFEGKLRKNEEASKYFRDLGILSINENMLWPEAWKLEINIRDLTPNNFNLYAEYYEHGFKAEEIATLEKEIGLIDAIRDAFSYIGVLTREMKKYGSEVAGDIENTAKSMKNSIGGFNNLMSDGGAGRKSN